MLMITIVSNVFKSWWIMIYMIGDAQIRYSASPDFAIIAMDSIL